MVLAVAPAAALPQSEIGLWLGSSSDDEETDLVRFTYRRTLFGSHVGTGLVLKNASVGVAF